MNEKKTISEGADELRQRAEEVARAGAARIPENLEGLSPEAARRIFHELQVHQVELEMQNEELRRAQGELEASRARYFDLYDLAPVGYVTLSEKGLILEANLTFATLLEVTRGELVKQPLTRFVLREDQDNYYRHRRQFFTTGTPQTYEIRMLRQEAFPFWAQIEAIAALDDDGAPVCRMVVSDITEHKRTDAKKAELEDQYRQTQKAQSLGRMAGAIAHHFNNQLQAVIGNLELSLCDLPPDKGPVKKLKAAMQAAGQAAEFSKVMLTYLGQTPGEREPLDLSETCRQNGFLGGDPRDIPFSPRLAAGGPGLCLPGSSGYVLRNRGTGYREYFRPFFFQQINRPGTGLARGFRDTTGAPGVRGGRE